MYRHVLLILLITIATLRVFAQTDTAVHCGQKTLTDKLLRENPQLRQYHEKVEKQLQDYHIAVRSGKAKVQRTTAIVTLPVVVHVIHNNSVENISNTQILTGIQHLNEAFANTGYYDPADGVNTQIQFCLAQRDPNGNATTGITRDVSPYTAMNGPDYYSDDQNIKNINRWNPSCYINIWLVRSIPGSVAGYAYLPSAHGMNMDGIVMEAFYFGSSNSTSVVTIHEMGHYLGLYHTFEGSCKNDDCTKDGDKVCDTPPDQSTASTNCATGMNSCSTDNLSGFTSDVSDLIEDYMDYGNFNCMKVFTQGQADRMNWHITHVRSSLLNCKSCLTPCPAPVTASYTVPATTIAAGTNMSTTNTSVNAAGYEWHLNNTQVSTGANFTNTYNTPGTFVLKLIAKSGNALCNNAEKEITITVTCPVKASFTPSVTTTVPNTAVTFTNTSTGATGYTWYIDGVQQATTTDLTHTFTAGGLYTIKLIATAANCKDSVIRVIRVKDDCHEYSFKKTYGGTGSDIAYDVCTTPDGSYVVAGSTTSFGTVAMDGFLMKLNNQGNLVWNYGYGGTADDVFRKVIPTPDGGYLAVGQTKSYGNVNGAAWVVKIKADGNIEWSRRFATGGEESANGVTITADGGYAITGNKYTSTTVSTVTLLKLDASGNLLWNKSFASTGKNIGTDIIDDNGALVINGYTGGGASYSDAFLMKLDAAGNILWTKKYDIGLQDNYSGNQLYKQGNTYLFTSPSNDNIFNLNHLKSFVVQTDDQGNVLQIHAINQGSRIGEGTSVAVPTAEGGYLEAHTTNANTDLFVIKCDKNWHSIYNKTHIEAGHQLSYALRITADGGLISVGYTDAPGNNDIYVVKTDILGNTGECLVYDMGLEPGGVTNAFNPHTWSSITSSNYGVANAITVTLTVGHALTTALCETNTPCAQPDSCSRRSSFRKTYSTTGIDKAQNIQLLHDGNFIIAGSITAPGRSDLDALLVKINGQGDTLWTKRFGGAADDEFVNAKPSLDGGIVAVGYSRSFGRPAGEMYIVKTDQQGNTLWMTSYTTNTANGERVRDLVEDASGVFYIIGDYDAGAGVSDVLVASVVSLTGNPYLTFRLDNNGMEDHGTGISVYQDTIMITGYTKAGTYNDAFLIKVRKANGSVFWSKAYDRQQGNDAFHQLYKTNEGFLINSSWAADNNNTGFKHGITKIDLNGNMISPWLNNTATTHAGPHSLYPTIDGGFVTVENPDNGSSDAYLYKFNATGTIQAQKQYTQPGNEQINQVIQNDDGSYMMAGITGAAAQSPDMYVIKTDIAANTLGCTTDSSSAALTVAPMTERTLTWTLTAPNTFGLYNTQIRTEVNPAILNPISLCLYSPCDTIIPPTPPDTCDKTFVYKYATPDSTNTFWQVLKTFDKHLLCIGQTVVSSATLGQEGMLAKMKYDGSIVWQKQFTENGTQSLVAAINTLDNHYMILGAQNVAIGNAGAFLIKMDADGNIVWKKMYFATQQGYGYTRIIQGSSDGAYYLMGGYSAGIGGEITITKIDANGTLVWSKAYNGPTATWLTPRDMADETSTILVVGEYYATDATQKRDGLVLRVSKSNGAVLSTQRVDLNINSAFYQILPAPNGEYIVNATTQDLSQNTAILKIDVNVNITAKALLQWGSANSPAHIAVNSKGEVFAASYTSPNIPLLFKLNNLLQPAWARKYNQHTGFSSQYLEVNENDNLFLTGTFTVGNKWLATLARYNSAGLLPSCPPDNLQLTAVQPNHAVFNVNTTIRDIQYNNNTMTLPETAPLLSVMEKLCESASGCDTLSIMGRDTICLPAGSNQLYKAFRNTGCTGVVNWTIDPAYADIVKTTDSTIELTFKKTDSVTLYGTMNIGCKILYDSLRIYIYASPNKVTLGPDVQLCHVSTWSLNAGTGFKSYLWQDGSMDSTLTAYNTGTYFVETYDYCGNVYRDTMVISQAPPVAFDLGADLKVCDKDTITLTAPAGFANYRWSANYKVNSIYGQSIKIFTDIDTLYSVTAELSPGCIVIDTIRISLKKTTPVHLGNDTSFCKNETITLDAGAGFDSYSWNTTAATQQITVGTAGTYIVDALHSNGCHIKDTLIVQKVYDLPLIDLGKDTVLCRDAAILFDAGNGYIDYKWQDGSANSQYSATQTGKYWVQVTDINKCINADTTLITAIKELPANFLADTAMLCEGQRITLQPLSSFTNYQWYNNAGASAITVTAPGKYWLQVTDGSNCKGKDTIEVFAQECLKGMFIPNAFTPNNDRYNDVFKPVVYGQLEKFRLTVYSRWGEKVFETNNPGLGWNGTWKGQPMDTGSFVWVCAYKFTGKSEKSEKGHVTLVR